MKTVFRDHCYERPPVLRDHEFSAEGPTCTFQYNWTCHQRPLVLTDHIFVASGVVFEDRFYCSITSTLHYQGWTLRAMSNCPGQLKSGSSWTTELPTHLSYRASEIWTLSWPKKKQKILVIISFQNVWPGESSFPCFRTSEFKVFITCGTEQVHVWKEVNVHPWLHLHLIDLWRCECWIVYTVICHT